MQTGKGSRAARFGGSLALLLGALLVFGCGSSQGEAASEAKKSDPVSKAAPGTKATQPDSDDAPEAAMQIVGSGGQLQMGDSLAAVQRAFPLPADGKLEKAPEFIGKGQTYWGWKSEKRFFDALFEKDKVVWFSYMDKSLDKAAREREIERELDLFGEPAENAEGTKASVYSWERGEAVRVLLSLNSGENIGLLRVVGQASILQAQLPLGSLGELVRSIDQSQ